MSAALTSRAISMKNTSILTGQANEVVMSFIEFKNAIKKFTLNAARNKASPTNNTKKALKDDVTTVLYTTDRLEKALKDYSKLNDTYKEKLAGFISQLYDFRIHMLPKIKMELSKKTPDFFYKAKRSNNYMQNLRNNITMRKTRQKTIYNSATGEITKQIEYISIPKLDMTLEAILPEREYSKIHPNAAAAAAANVEGPGNLFGTTEGGKRRRTHKRRHTRRN